MGESSIISCTLCRQSTKTPGKAVLAKNLFRYAKNLPVFLTLHSKDFFNAVRKVVDIRVFTYFSLLCYNLRD